MPWLTEKKKEERVRDDRWSTLPWTFTHGIRSRLRRNLSTTERSTSINLLLRLLPFSDVHPWFPSPLQLSRLLPRISFLPVLSKWFQLCLSLSLWDTRTMIPGSASVFSLWIIETAAGSFNLIAAGKRCSTRASSPQNGGNSANPTLSLSGSLLYIIDVPTSVFHRLLILFVRNDREAVWFVLMDVPLWKKMIAT